MSNFFPATKKYHVPPTYRIYGSGIAAFLPSLGAKEPLFMQVYSSSKVLTTTGKYSAVRAALETLLRKSSSSSTTAGNRTRTGVNWATAPATTPKTRTFLETHLASHPPNTIEQRTARPVAPLLSHGLHHWICMRRRFPSLTLFVCLWRRGPANIVYRPGASRSLSPLPTSRFWRTSGTARGSATSCAPTPASCARSPSPTPSPPRAWPRPTLLPRRPPTCQPPLPHKSSTTRPSPSRHGSRGRRLSRS